MKNVTVVVPAYNEEKTISKAIKILKNHGYNSVIVVDDGSKDNTYELALKEGAKVYRHIINRGLGGALNTGISASLMNGAEFIVTFDADLQHNPKDIKKLIDALNLGYDVAIGNRINKNMPLIRRIGNKGLDFFTWIIFGKYVHDTQSGLRAFTRNAASKINLRTNRMEVSSEIIREVSINKLKLREVPIDAIYTEYSQSKGNTSFIDGIKILTKLMFRRIME